MTETAIITIAVGFFISMLTITGFIHQEIMLDKKYQLIKENPSWNKLQKLKKDINFVIDNPKLLFVDKVNYIRGLIE